MLMPICVQALEKEAKEMQTRHAEQLEALKATYEKQTADLKSKHSKTIEEITEDHIVRKKERRKILHARWVT